MPSTADPVGRRKEGLARAMKVSTGLEELWRVKVTYDRQKAAASLLALGGTLVDEAILALRCSWSCELRTSG